MAKYRLLADHYVGDRYLEADSIVTTGVELPVGWIPSLSADPLDSDAVQALWNQGPGPLLPEVFAWPGGSRWSNVDKPKPSVYWQKASSDASVLTGAGASLGLRVARPIFTPPTFPIIGDGSLDFSSPNQSAMIVLLEDI